MKRRFVIPSLLAAGFLPVKAAVAALPPVFDDDANTVKPQSLFDVFTVEHKYTLAAHGSHVSHSSHVSHASHQSSAGGGYVYRPATPAPTTTTTPLVTLPGNSQTFQQIVRLVQNALAVYGYYQGSIDGMVGPMTAAAIRQYQSAFGLAVTGTITPELLTSMHIPAV